MLLYNINIIFIDIKMKIKFTNLSNNNDISLVLKEPDDSRTPNLDFKNQILINKNTSLYIDSSLTTANLFIWKIIDINNSDLVWKGIIPVGIDIDINPEKKAIYNNGEELPANFAPIISTKEKSFGMTIGTTNENNNNTNSKIKMVIIIIFLILFFSGLIYYIVKK
jgi:hypothetical protein